MQRPESTIKNVKLILSGLKLLYNNENISQLKNNEHKIKQALHKGSYMNMLDIIFHSGNAN